MKRRLAAVAFADLAGFSRLVGQDELATARLWEDARNSVLLPLVAQHEGALVETAGDSILVEFGSAVLALQWAIAAQEAMKALPPNELGEDLQLRVSVNVDDVLPSQNTLLGDGINIASRIHQAGEPGQIVVTSLVRELIGNRLAVRFTDLGTPRLKNISRIVHVYLAEAAEHADQAGLHQPFLEWSSRPTVAVLPFRSASNHETERYFSSGITEDIIAGLSRSRAFNVIARASTLQFEDRKDDIRDIAAKLGVDYILDGSVRRFGDRLRISAELVNIGLNRAIWTERYDGSAEEIFDFQDEIVASVAGSFEPRLRKAEEQRVRNRPTDSLDAYNCVLKAMASIFVFTEEGFMTSGIALRRALELDPNYARAHATSAWRLVFLLGQERADDPADMRARAIDHARRAVELDPEDAFCQIVAAHLTSWAEGNPHEALSMFDTALELDSNNAMGWAVSAMTLSFLGRGEDAMQRFQNTFKLSPFDSLNFAWWCGAGIAAFVSRDYDEATRWLRKSLKANPRYAATLRMLAASLALQGRTDEAQSVGQTLLELDPTFTIDGLMAWYPLVRDEDRAALETGLRLAGLPQ